MLYTTFYFVRHGQSESNQAEVLGQKNSHLTETGRTQAEWRANTFKSIIFDHVFSSTFVRAKETALIIAKILGLDHIEESPLLIERSWGSLEDQHTSEGRNKLAVMRKEFEKLSREDRMHVRMVPDMESDAEALSRLLGFIKQNVKLYPDKTVLCVGHANILKILLVHIGFATWPELPSGSVKHVAYAAIKTDGHNFNVLQTDGIVCTKT